MLLAAVDYAWQRRRNEKSMGMTKEEVERSHARATWPPMRGAIRRRQFAPETA